MGKIEREFLVSAFQRRWNDLLSVSKCLNGWELIGTTRVYTAKKTGSEGEADGSLN